MRNEKYGKQTFRTSSIFVLVLSLSAVGFTQDRRPDRGIQQANSYSISDIENVNTTNGNLMLHVSLASVPGGRGTSSGYTVALNYNSKLWNAKRQRRTDGIGQNPEDSYYSRELVEPSEQGGWYLDSGGYRLNLVNRLSLETEAPCMEYSGAAAYLNNAYQFKLEMQLPDGMVKEFRPFGYGYENGDGYFSLDPYGVQHSYSYMPPGPFGGPPACSQSTSQVTTAGINYYTNDGSNLRLFLPYQPGTGVPLMRWTMYFPDGRVLEYLPADDTSVYQRLTDRNGNKMSWKEATLNGYSGSKIENEVGQFVFIGENAGVYKIIQPGANGVLLETTFQWKDVYVHRRYRATSASNAPTTAIYEDLFQNMGMVDKITLPAQAGGLEYSFTYNGDDTSPGTGNYTDGWGELKSITLPSTARADYSYVLDGDTNPKLENFNVVGNSVTGRVLVYHTQYDGGTQPVIETTGYGTSVGVGGSCSPDGRCQSQVSAVGGDLAGYAYRISQTGGSVTEKIWMNKRPMGGSVYALIEPFVKTEFTSVPDANGNPTLTATKDLDYDQNGNILEIREYDWVAYSSVPRSSTGQVTEYLPLPRATGLPAGLTLKRRTINTYYYPTPNTLDPGLNSPNHYSNPASPKFKNLLKSTEIKDGNGTTASRAEFYYDGGLSAPDKRDLTETKIWDSTKGAVSNPLTTGTNGNSISTTAVYDQYGNPTLVTDAQSNQTQITYGPVNGFAGLYPTQTISAFGTPIARTSTAAYDFYTGLVTTATDVDNNLTNAMEYDALGRPIKVKSAYNTPLESWVQTSYDDVNRRVIVKSDIDTVGDARKVATQFFDQLGRVRLSKTLEDAETQSATNETDGIKVETRYQTGNPNSYQLTSNPFRAAYASQATNEQSMGWTRSKAINTGRHAETESFSGSALPAPWGTNTNSTGLVQTDLDANTVTVTDQALKQRRSITNALGQLVRVDEPNNAGQLGTVASPNQPTSYSYNTLGKMIRVQQGVQNRYFLYDSLGRTLRVRQPEQEVNAGLDTTGNPNNNSWTAGFAYDNNGNVLTTTDAKGTTITNTYDALNRPLTRTYANEPQGVSTPAVTNYYDGLGLPSVPQFSKGKLTLVASSVSESRYTEFDQLGRLKQYQQLTDGNTYTSSYQYNLSGALTQETYPSGRVVKNEFETDGDLAKVTSQKAGGSVYAPYASNISYSAAGAVTSMRLGNGKWENASFNSRLQPVQLGLGASMADTGLWKVNYEYGELQTNGSVDVVKNNGNIAKQTLNVPGTNFVQAYKYDPLNRLTEAKETTGTTQNWIQQFGYDVYGNRTSFSQTIGGQTTTTTPGIDPNSNRFNLGQGFTFDKNGNVTNDVDSMTSHTRQFIFNGDNKQTQVKDVTNNNHVVGTYFYDGENKRIKKVTDTETTIFVYSAGKLIAEYSTAVAPTAEAKIAYTTTDHLGSPRIITDQLGQVKSRRDFMPFGEELNAGVGARTGDSGLKYSSSADNVRQKFTGYQKDSETNLDFAEARMYENRFGRFTAVDPLMASGKSADPQSFNRYIYVRNNPLILTDPSGQIPGDYYSRDGTYLGNDGEDDQIIYFATATRQDDQSTWIDVNSRVETTLDAVLKAQDAAVPLSPGTDNEAVGALTGSIADGSIAGATGIAKGVANFGIDTLNTVTQPGGLLGAAAGIPNPLAVPNIAASNSLEQSYIDTTKTGLTVGTIVAGGAVSGASSVSIAPETAANSVPRTADVLGHIFKAGDGHVAPTTGASQQRFINLFERVANNPNNQNPNVLSNFQRTNTTVQGFSQNFRNGQVWAQAGNGRIFNAGVNRIPR